MKKLLLIFLIAAASAFSGCGRKEGIQPRLTVVTSFYPVYIIAKNVTRDVPGVSVVNFTPPITGCLHDYSVTAADMKKLEKADLMLINGAGMEPFMDSVLSRYPSLPVAVLSKGIPTIKDANGENAHLWVSLSLYRTIVQNCIDAICERDKMNEKLYRQRGKEYLKKIETLKTECDREMFRFRGRKIITFHEAFPYFALEYGLVITAVIEREPGSEPSAKEIADTINLVRKSGIKTLFTEPQYPSSSAEVIAKGTGAKVLVLDPAATGPDEYDAYLSIMRRNIAAMKEAFSE